MAGETISGFEVYKLQLFLLKQPTLANFIGVRLINNHCVSASVFSVVCDNQRERLCGDFSWGDYDDTYTYFRTWFNFCLERVATLLWQIAKRKREY